MGDTYQYIGGERRGYLAYVDTDTQRMLIADPGGEYRMRGASPEDEVPPPDGLWVTSTDAPTGPAPTPPIPPQPAWQPPAATQSTTGDATMGAEK